MMIEDFSNTKKDIATIFFIIIVVSIAFFLVSCKPAQVITLTDTIKQIEYKTKFEKEIVRFDSIVTKTDTFSNIVFRDRTVYQTKEHTKIDSIYLDKEVIKENPVNQKLQKDNDKLSNKLENRNRLALYLSIALIVLAAFMWIKSKFS